MDELFTKFDSTFFEKTRLSILTILYREGSVSFNRLKELLSGTDGAVYSHIEKLSKEGYIGKVKEIVGISVQTVYNLTEKGKAVLTEYLDYMESLMKSGLRGESR